VGWTVSATPERPQRLEVRDQRGLGLGRVLPRMHAQVQLRPRPARGGTALSCGISAGTLSTTG
jgi:hypothetical protein